MTRDIFDTPPARELSELLYSKLKESKNGELSFDEIINLFDSKTVYGLSRVNGGAISIIREREDVQELKDENNHPFLKLF
jgi:predicted CopG family antitoxin